jgi:chromosome segregation ATPase
MHDSEERIPLAALIVAALLLLFANDALAQAAKQGDRDRETIRRLQQQLQKAQQDAAGARNEKAELEKQLAAQKDELEKQRAELPKAQGEASRERGRRQSAEGEAEKLKAQLAERDKALAEARARGDDLARRERDALAVIAERDRGLKAYQADLGRQNKEILACEAKNAQLYALNVEILERYRTKSVADVLAREEPFTGLRNVEVFNVVQEYRDKLDGQRVVPPAGGAVSRP